MAPPNVNYDVSTQSLAPPIVNWDVSDPNLGTIVNTCVYTVNYRAPKETFPLIFLKVYFLKKIINQTKILIWASERTKNFGITQKYICLYFVLADVLKKESHLL